MKTYMLEQKGCRYFRMRVPKELRSCLHQEIRYSVRSLDLQTADFRCKLLGRRLQELFDQAKQGKISMSILNPFVREICANILYYDARLMTSMATPAAEYENACRYYQQCLQQHDAGGAPEFIQLAQQNGVSLNPADPAALPIIMNYYQGMAETCRILKERASGNLHNGYDAPDEHGNLSPELSPQDETATFSDQNSTPKISSRVSVDGKLDAVEVPLPKQEPTQQEKTLSLSAQLAQAARHRTLRTQPLPVPFAIPVYPPAPMVQSPVPPNISKVLTLDEAIEAYLSEKRMNGRLDPKVELTRRTILSVISEIFGGDRKLYEIDRDMIIKLRKEVLPKYPWNRAKIYPGQSLPQLLKLIPAPKPISETSQRHYMEYWSMFFNWCVQCGYLVMNPAKGVVPKPALEDLTEQRPPFNPKELKRILEDLVTMKDEPRFISRVYSFRYWIPLIGLYQGMRLNEICQLHLDDVCITDGIPCLRIKPDKERSQKVKNASSIRQIPIHSVLLKLNFLGYVLERRASKRRHNDQLFEALTLSEGGYQRKMQQFNVRLHRKLKIDAKKSFHSFRHNFDTELSNKEPNAFLIQCLDGHARQGELGARYSKGNLGAMKKTLEKVDYKIDVFKIMQKQPIAPETITAQIKELTLLQRSQK